MKVSLERFSKERRRDFEGATLFGRVRHFLRKWLFLVLSFGPMPDHIAFILDGNRRFAKQKGLKHEDGHKAGLANLITTLQYCYEMGVKHVTVYAFSIDNFKRKPKEVQPVMDLYKERIIQEFLDKESILNRYGVRINVWGDLSLLSDPMRIAAEKVMRVTAKNTGSIFSACMAYTSTDEIMHAIEEVFTEKMNNVTAGMISVADLEEHLYTSECPEPDIVIRTSGETRLSNFLLWQTAYSHLRTPVCLWPEFSLAYLVWAILEYQKVYPYLRKLRGKLK